MEPNTKKSFFLTFFPFPSAFPGSKGAFLFFHGWATHFSLSDRNFKITASYCPHTALKPSTLDSKNPIWHFGEDSELNYKTVISPLSENTVQDEGHCLFASLVSL